MPSTLTIYFNHFPQLVSPSGVTLFPCPALTVKMRGSVYASVSPWQHSSKTEPVRGLCLTSLFNQTQTHTSGQPGPRYLSLPPSARCTHPVLSLFCSLLLLFQHSSSASSSPPVQHPCASHCLPALHLSPLPVSCSLCPLHPLLLPTPLLWAPLSLRDVTFSTDSGAAASKLGQNWLKMSALLVCCLCTNRTVTCCTHAETSTQTEMSFTTKKILPSISLVWFKNSQRRCIINKR